MGVHYSNDRYDEFHLSSDQTLVICCILGIIPPSFVEIIVGHCKNSFMNPISTECHVNYNLTVVNIRTEKGFTGVTKPYL